MQHCYQQFIEALSVQPYQATSCVLRGTNWRWYYFQHHLDITCHRHQWWTCNSQLYIPGQDGIDDIGISEHLFDHRGFSKHPVAILRMPPTHGMDATEVLLLEITNLQFVHYVHPTLETPQGCWLKFWCSLVSIQDLLLFHVGIVNCPQWLWSLLLGVWHRRGKKKTKIKNRLLQTHGCLKLWHMFLLQTWTVRYDHTGDLRIRCY